MHPNGWINAHLILMTGIVLMIPAYLAITNYLKDGKYISLAHLSIFFTCLSVLLNCISSQAWLLYISRMSLIQRVYGPEKYSRGSSWPAGKFRP
jgi:hypothetical protein